MVEFALILPVLLMTMYGVMEFGRLLFIYVTTASASREAARYAAAIGISDNGVEFYNDCAGIRAAAQRVGILAGIQDSDVVIQYDQGPGTTPYSVCPAPGSGPGLGDRIVVSVTGHFQPVVPVVPIPIQDIQSVTARTMVRNVTVSENFVAPPIVVTPVVSPFVYFSDASVFVAEGSTVPVIVQTDVEVGLGEFIRVSVDVLDVMEASLGYDYDLAFTNPVTFTGGQQYQTINILIHDDTLFENYERIVLYLRDVEISSDGENWIDAPDRLGYPRFHIIRIIPDPNDAKSLVYFDQDASSTSENRPEGHRVQVNLNTPSGAPGWVNFTVTGVSDPIGDEPQAGVDFTFSPATGQLYFAVSPLGTRTTGTVGYITIYPIDNLIDNQLRWVQIVLTSPFNLELGSPTVHTVELIDDDDCDIVADNLNFSLNELSMNLVNNGINDNISWINLSFSSSSGITRLQSIELSALPLWSDTAATGFSPIVIPSDENGIWLNPTDLFIEADGIGKQLRLSFTAEDVSQVDSFTMGFDTCPSISFSNIVNPYP
jgi:hypothetical protein